jgi:DNA-binding MarR family transcriptional regulator
MTRQWQRYRHLRREVLEWIREFNELNGYPPVNAEIGEAFDYSKAWVSQFLDRLERDGLITRARESGTTKSRTILLTRAAEQLLERRREHQRQ